MHIQKQVVMTDKNVQETAPPNLNNISCQKEIFYDGEGSVCHHGCDRHT